MKILYVITGLGLGGAERQVIDISDTISKEGHSVKIFILTPNIKLKPANGNIELISIDLKKNPFSFIKNILKFRKIVSGYEPDIIHSHMVHANFFSRFAKFFTKKTPLICSAHNSNEGGLLRNSIYRLTNNLAELNTNVSAGAKEAFEKTGAIKRGSMVVVHNGIDIDKYQPIPKIKDHEESNKVFNFFTAGRLTDAKDHITLIKAFHLLKANNPQINFQLSIAGAGPNYKKIETTIKELNLSMNIFLLGPRNDISKLMNNCDAFVLSSAWEGLPLVIGEAMACQKVVITTDCSGARDYLNNSQFISPIKDHVSLYQKILMFTEASEEEIISIGKNNRKIIKNNFSLEAISKKWIGIYESTISNKNF